jgi:hypothetical protein
MARSDAILPRIIAVDWSGARAGAHRKIWLAEARGEQLLRLESGRSRDDVATHLVEEARGDPYLVVGLDFAFSLPAWFLRERELKTAGELWRLADREAEGWLERCEHPFWGRPGRGRPDLEEHYRRTDRDVPSVGGIRPKSPFQIGGAGAVGTGSLRGMPILHRLSERGFRIWPFDAVGFPLAVEIYPRLLTGPVRKSSARHRAAELGRRFPQLSATQRAVAASSEDAFDAAISALQMAKQAHEFANLAQARDPVDLLEGRIWWAAMP